MAIAYTKTPVEYAQEIVTQLKSLNSEIKGKDEADLLKMWTAICLGHQTFNIDALLVTTSVEVTGVMSGTSTATGTGTSA